MSSATDCDKDAAASKPSYERSKIAIFFAYCGVGYLGMQRNPGAKTIEADLEEALFHAGSVPEQDRGNSKRYDFARSARTDKGVSAVGQVVSGNFYIDPPGLVERLNSVLPEQIRIFGYKRVTSSFSSKKFCDWRRYVYLIPAFSLDPTCHRDRESVMASLGSDTVLVKCLECPERGRKVVGAMGKRPRVRPDSKDCSEEDSFERNVGSGIVSTNGNSEPVKEPEVAQGKVDSQNVDATGGSVPNENGDLGSEPLGNSIAAGVEEEEINKEEKSAKRSQFRYGEEERVRFNRILKNFVGSHSFHNFTTRTKANDPAVIRNIISFDASNTVTVDGIEFVKCEVVGQSFILHQIRKMMGLAVAVMRNCAPESLIETALQKDVNISVPTAPEVGLYLDECMFSSYNQEWKDTHEELSMKDYAEEAEEFKMKHIYTHIAATERKVGVVAQWLHSLNLRNYADLGFMSRNGALSNGKSDEVDNGKSDQGQKISENGKSYEMEQNTE